MIGLIGGMLFIILGIIAVIGILAYLFWDKKIICQNCLQKVESSRLKCNHCGNFIEKKMAKGSKIFNKMDRRVTRNINDAIKQVDRHK